MVQKTLEFFFKGLLIFSGLFNIIFATPLIFPFTSNRYLAFMSLINDFFNLGGNPFTLPSNAVHSLFINTAGIDLVLIGVIVLICSLKPLNNFKIIFANAIGRMLFFFIILYYVISKNLLKVVIVFGVIDLVISILFLFFIYKLKNNAMNSQ